MGDGRTESAWCAARPFPSLPPSHIPALPILTRYNVPAPPPQPRHLLLPRPHFVERVALVQSAVLHHIANRVRVFDVVERILIENLKVGELTGFQRSDVLLVADRLGAED